eukprot:TRINITY_DN1094_c0_g1_i1.p1 TRINITY_DN1094_c0_g1~~TRINITY_DN1094_c0_g1_i1.p1  ORF type:complete len:625 (-),score=150.66 TRINITY_DN1094_c0_g1_i1:26-1900(-)
MFLRTSLFKASLGSGVTMPTMLRSTLPGLTATTSQARPLFPLLALPIRQFAYRRPQLTEADQTKLTDAKRRFTSALEADFDYGGFKSTLSRRKESGDSRDRGGRREMSYPKRRDYNKGFTRRPERVDLDAPAPEWNTEELKQKVQLFDYKPTKQMTEDEKKSFLKTHGIKIQKAPADFQPIVELDDTPFPEEIKKIFKSKGFEKPTPVQSVGWSLTLQNHDTIGVAETGSGKTLTFMIPLSEHVKLQNPKHTRKSPFVAKPRAIVLAPTRELAQQIHDEARPYLASNKQESVVVYGGAQKSTQLSNLEKTGGHIVIGTPGRLTDLIESGYISLEQVSFVVFDEADRMLDMGFHDQIRLIMKFVPPVRQTMMWSATWPKEVRSLADEFVTHDAVRFNVGSEELMANKRIRQNFVFCSDEGRHPKLITLLSQISEEKGKAIIFVNKKSDVDKLSWELEKEKIDCVTIHGDKTQAQRDDSLLNFRRNRVRVLIATDVAARGLDVKDVSHVINYDAPLNAESYVHRIGRTGRAGAEGVSVTFFTPFNASLATEFIPILKEAKQEIPSELLDYAKIRTRSRSKPYEPFDDYNRGRRGGRGEYSSNSKGYRSESRGRRTPSPSSRGGYNR